MKQISWFLLFELQGAQATKCITLDAQTNLNKSYGFNFDLMNGLANLKELRFLFVNTYGWDLEFDEDSLHLPNALRFLYWAFYPFSSLPKTLKPNNLVGLQMSGSNMDQLWKDGEEKPFLKLRFLKFTYSDYLRTLDLSVAPNLETLILDECKNLVEVDFQVTPNLKELRIKNCKRLEKLHMPAECLKLLRSLDLLNLIKLRTFHLEIAPNLETLRLWDCASMVELHMPAQCPKLVDLDLYDLRLRTLHLGITPNLETLRLNNCLDLVELQIPAECPKLINLDLIGCIKVAELPGEIGLLECLKELDITGTGIRHLPESILRVKGLRIVGSCGSTSEIKTSDKNQEQKSPVLRSNDDFELEYLKELDITGAGTSQLPESILRVKGLCGSCGSTSEIKASDKNQEQKYPVLRSSDDFEQLQRPEESHCIKNFFNRWCTSCSCCYIFRT